MVFHIFRIIFWLYHLMLFYRLLFRKNIDLYFLLILFLSRKLLKIQSLFLKFLFQKFNFLGNLLMLTNCLKSNLSKHQYDSLKFAIWFLIWIWLESQHFSNIKPNQIDVIIGYSNDISCVFNHILDLLYEHCWKNVVILYWWHLNIFVLLIH